MITNHTTLQIIYNASFITQMGNPKPLSSLRAWVSKKLVENQQRLVQWLLGLCQNSFIYKKVAQN